MITLHSRCSLILEKVQKKYKHAKKALEASQDLDESEKIPYPTGQTPGQGDLKLKEYLKETSGVSPEEYNSFIVRGFMLLESTC